MAKDDLIKMTGIIDECLPGTMFRVRLNDTHVILATLSGRLRQNNIRILLGDSVEVEMSVYDISRGRITYRNK